MTNQATALLLWQEYITNAAKTPVLPNPKAQVVMTAFTAGGVAANGKVGAVRRFFPPFCEAVHQRGYSVEWAATLTQLQTALDREDPTFIVHLFGEDNVQIASPELDELEVRAIAVFNAAHLGVTLEDKLATQKVYESHGVPSPSLTATQGFVRQRKGSGQDTRHVSGAADVSSATANEMSNVFIDTRVAYEGNDYFTTVRILCVDDRILHAWPRARDAKEENPNVHSKNTPLNPGLIEHLQKVLVASRLDELRGLASKLFVALGHGFFVHDLLLDRASQSFVVCESGFKFNDMTYKRHISRIAGQLPSQEIFRHVGTLGRLSGETFAEICDEILETTHCS